MQFTQKMVGVRSIGGSTLHVTAVGVNGNGNPDFSVVPPSLPQTIKPGNNMPAVPLTASELQALSAYLAALK